LPHSGAAVERAFSKLKIIKNDKRSSLSNDTLESLMIATVNDYDVEDPKLLDQLYEYYESNHSNIRKRKYSAISKSNSNQEINEIDHALKMEDEAKKMEVEPTENRELMAPILTEEVLNEIPSLQLKKLKLTSVTKTDDSILEKDERHAAESPDIFEANSVQSKLNRIIYLIST